MVYERGMTQGINIHLYPSDLTSESRMMKITASLAALGLFRAIWLIGVQSPATATYEVVDATRVKLRFPRGFAVGPAPIHTKILGTLRWSWAVWRHLRGQPITCINCHSLPVLPLSVALKFRHRAKLVYDTHELETETSVSHGIRRPLLKLLERGLIRFSDLTIVVGEMISGWYARAYRIAPPLVVRNIPFASNASLTPRATSPLRAKLGLGAEAVVVLYLGRLSVNRGIERLLVLFAQTHMHLVFMGEGPLTPVIEAACRTHANLHMLPPVPMGDVIAHARGADMGVSVIDHSCLSYTYAMPNKFFEYLQAGVPVLVGDMPEQRAIIEEHHAGWVLPEEDAAARAFLRGLTRAEIDKKQAHAMAIAGVFSWEKEAELLKRAYIQLMGGVKPAQP